jgi:hypothetical protein
MTLTPKKIYLLAHDLAFLSSKEAKPILYNCDISIVDVLGGQYPYILESEHNRLVDELKAENEKLKEDIPKWISVEERMPDYDGKYLCFVDEKEPCGAEYKRQYILSNHCNIWVTNKNTTKVSHWMPLPEPPKEK